MCANLNDVVSGAYARLGTANLSSVTSGNLVDIANDVLVDMAELTGQTIDSGDIPSRFLSPARDYTAAYAIVHSSKAQVGENITIGNIRLEYTDLNEQLKNQVDYFMKRADNAVSMQGQRLAHTYTTKSD